MRDTPLMTVRRHALPAVACALATLAVVIALAAPARAAMTLTVRPIGGSSFTISADPTDTVAVVKQTIENAQGIPVANQRLIFAGRQLQDANTLADYNVFDGSTIYIVVRSPAPSSGATSAEPAPIPMWFQSYARPISTQACAVGWNPSWAEWPYGHTGGWTCDRAIPALGQ